MSGIPQFALEPLERVRTNRLEDLAARHFREVGHFQDIPLEVDWQTYAGIEAAGKLRIFTARIAGELVGYVCYILNHNLHYKSSLQAVQDVLFLAPEHRGARIGANLVRFSEGQLAAEGVQVVYQHSKVKPELSLTSLLTRMGYELVDTVWAKRLDRENN